MLLVRKWWVIFEVVGFVDRWYHQETGHRCSAELGRGERGFFPLLDCLHLVLKWKMLLHHKSTATQHWLTMLKSGWMCQCGSQGVHSSVRYPVIIWNVFNPHFISQWFTCFFCKNHFSRAVLFSHPKIPCFGAHFGHLFPPTFGRHINVPSKQRLLEIWLLWDLNSEFSAGCWLGRGNLS